MFDQYVQKKIFKSLMKHKLLCLMFIEQKRKEFCRNCDTVYKEMWLMIGHSF